MGPGASCTPSEGPETTSDQSRHAVTPSSESGSPRTCVDDEVLRPVRVPARARSQARRSVPLQRLLPDHEVLVAPAGAVRLVLLG